jgi:hypothetical protein
MIERPYPEGPAIVLIFGRILRRCRAKPVSPVAISMVARIVDDSRLNRDDAEE